MYLLQSYSFMKFLSVMALFIYPYTTLCLKSQLKFKVGLGHQIGVGLLSGGFSIAVANPFDVLKVKFQSDIVPVIENGRVVLKKNYKNLRHAMVEIPRVEGWRKGYYLSLWPNIMRNSIVNAIELAAFSQMIYLFR